MRPELLRTTSASAPPQPSKFTVTAGTEKNQATAMILGSCVSCMAAARDVYDEMHGTHMAASNSRSSTPTPRKPGNATT